VTSSRARRIAGGVAIGVAPILVVGFGVLGIPPRPSALRPIIDAAKPGVTWLDVETLRRLLDGPAPPVLADVRTPREWAASHLPGAIRVAPGARSVPPELAEALETLAVHRAKLAAASSTPLGPGLVTYCTVGWRSGGFAGAVRDRVDGGVRNLEGGILAWANAGGRLVDPDGRRVRRVHPHDPLVGWLFSRAPPP